MDLIEILRKKIIELLGRKITLLPQANLIEYGLDSIKTIQLIVSLEEEFEIAFREDDLITDNFETIEKIVLMLDKYI